MLERDLFILLTSVLINIRNNLLKIKVDKVMDRDLNGLWQLLDDIMLLLESIPIK